MAGRLCSATIVILSLAGCTLLTPLDGYSGGDDGLPDAATSRDGGGDVVLADTGATTEAGADDCPAQVDPALIAYFRFGDGSGTTVKDCSGKGNDATIDGTGVFTTGRSGGGLHFNGTSTCLDVGRDKGGGLTSFTVAAWVNVKDFAQLGAPRFFAAKTTNANDRGWRFGSEAGGAFGVKIGRGASEVTLVSPGGQPTETWLHVGMVFVQDGEVAIFIGGARAAAKPAGPAIVEDTDAHLRVGCFAGALGQGYNFSGVVDELRIYSRALTDAEMTALAR